MRKRAKQTEEITSDLTSRLATELVKAYSDLLFEIDRDEKLLKGIQRRDEEIRRLKSQIRKLESTKSLRLQRRYWNLRKKILGNN
ncbi:hypothetical protein HMPREF2808_08830 [Corynebacterium sp. HMSC078A10]|nr:hypothetical protein HMPREF2808_08830 [Corynebacterium sp. HMSC078A10]